MFVKNDHSLGQLKEEQTKDFYIRSTKGAIESNTKVTVRRLKRIQYQLRIIDSVLTKSGRRVYHRHSVNLKSLNTIISAISGLLKYMHF